MSRVGKLPIVIPQNVKVHISGLSVNVEGPKGSLKKNFSGKISLVVQDGTIIVKPLDYEKQSIAMWGTARSIINNMIQGVVFGYKKQLEVIGVGYRVALKGKFLSMTLGKSHNTVIEVPDGINVLTPKQDIIELEAINNEKLGQFVALIKRQRPPEPYKGKGIRCKGEFIIRKEGKKS